MVWAKYSLFNYLGSPGKKSHKMRNSSLIMKAKSPPLTLIWELANNKYPFSQKWENLRRDPNYNLDHTLGTRIMAI